MSYPTSEHDEQCILFEWARWNLNGMPELAMMFAIPNGGARHIAVARKLKSEGVKAGVPDIFLPVASKGFHGLFIELKTVERKPKKSGKGGISEEQDKWIKALQVEGYNAVVCYGSKEAMETIKEYLK